MMMCIRPGGFPLAGHALLILFLFFFPPAFAREGVEVSVKEIPADAFKYLQTYYPEARKVKYFMEMDKVGQMRYEVKLKYKGDRFDLTFDSSGGIVEVEKEIDCATIEDAAHHKIMRYFNSNFSRYHIYKCEEVASGGENFFEIKLRGKRPDGEHFFEAF
ncbi:MAG TPA: hypothetical protein VIU43_04045, partial [Nitrosospira sp.]